ncbi:MAG: proline--tRNA ligase [Clostridia bacterium]|nr:proline--tRNA ligase [Clostridia bacterium]
MYISKLVGERTKTSPADAVIKSHALMIRAGYMKLVSNGIWSLAMPAQRISQKIENIIREEMNAIEGQECLFPVVMPRELWDESGRYSSIGDEMVRFKDRKGGDFVLGMTHEEAAVQFARDAVNSYNQLPFMIYQIQTKFRDEGRARGGLIRVREFKMKDAYSFHIDQQDLEKYYYRAYAAYERIFKRIGMKNFIAVTSDSGMMGGKISHEFMLLTDVGEDTLVLCPKCGYKSNMEVANSVVENYADEVELPMEEVYTADAKEIAEVTKYLGDIPAYKTAKAVCYNIKGDSKTTVVCFVRGDLEVNEAKLKKVLRKEVVPAGLEGSALVAGNIGCLGLDKLKDVVVVYDNSLKGANNMVIGANKEEYHIKNFSFNRDIQIKEFHDIAKVVDGARCIHCGAPLTLQNDIEIGNIFQLGTKYTEAMGMTVLNKDGKATTPIMGCYGIGVGRAIASIAEESADEKGLNWPMAIAPWHVYLCALRPDDPVVREKADKLYQDLQSAGIEVLYDDRNVSPGFKFNDCDLMGIPVRVVISPRSIQNGIVEVQLRDGTLKENLNLDDCVGGLKKIIEDRI